MNCERVEQLLSEQLEGWVSEREAGALQAHLGLCPACRRRQAEFAATRHELRAMAQHLPLAESDVDRRAIDHWMAERKACNTGWRRWLRPVSTAIRPARTASGLGLAGAAAALLLAALAFHSRAHDPVSRSHLPEVAIQTSGDTGTTEVRPAPQVSPHGPGKQIAHLPPSASGPTKENGPDPDTARMSGNRGGARGSQSLTVRLLTPRRLREGRVGDDLAYLNGDPLKESRRWVALRPDERAKIEAKVRRDVRVRDDFVTIPFPLLASTSDRQIAEAVESYKREAAIVDPRLVREVTCAFKATALADLCRQLRSDTGIELTAGPSVGDEKVTLLCEKMPLREVMRQLSRPFGYTWLRSGTPGEYRYELEQDLRAQLQEEELRNRDRDQALLALDRAMEGYQPYLALSPEEAWARARTAAPEAKKLLEALAGEGWGPIHMYFQLSPQEQAVLRAGGTITFSAAPKPGEQPLPPDVARTVLQNLREGPASMNPRAMNTDAGSGPVGVVQGLPALSGSSSGQGAGAGPVGHVVQGIQIASPGGAPPSPNDPDAQAQVSLSLSRSELGRFTLSGLSGVTTSGGSMMRGVGPYAVGTSPTATQPADSAVNARLATDPALRRRISVQPKPHCWEPAFSGPGKPPAFDEAILDTAGEPAQSKIQDPKSKIGRVNSADVLEALHLATGLPIVADFYTHLYSPEAVSVTNQPIFTALNQLAGAMKLRWDKQGQWLQFRTAGFYNDRLKEVPNRLLARWSAARPKSGTPWVWLPLAQLLEMARCSDAQMDAADMAEGMQVCWGLPEWNLVRSPPGRQQLRFLAGFTEPQLHEAMSPAGLAFTRMSVPQQQQFLSHGMGPNASPPLDALAGASLHVQYLQPGAFCWTPTGAGPGSEVRNPARQAPLGKNAWRWLPDLAPVVAPKRQAALEAARRLDPQAQESQIMPTDLAVTLVYVWGNPKTGGMASTQRLAASQAGLGMMRMRRPLPPIEGSEPVAPR